MTSIEKIIDFITRHILYAKRDKLNSVLMYGERVLQRADLLMYAETDKYKDTEMEGIESYTSNIRNSILVTIRLIKEGRVSPFLGKQLLKNINRKLGDAIEIFKNGFKTEFYGDNQDI